MLAGPSSARRLRVDEREAARIGRDAADDEVHPVRQAEPVAANLDELAGGDQGAEPPLERRPLLARNLEELQEFLGRRRMIHPVADQLE